MHPQQQQGGKSKSLIIGVVVIIVIVIIYFYMSGSSSSSSNSLLQGEDVSGIGANELMLLNQIKSLHIDTTLFKDPAYTSLVDYTVAITPENVGRPNPFAPIPGMPISTSTRTR